MKKIPTMFERDWMGDKSKVIDKLSAACEWVQAGEGIATRKIDGTSCLVRDGKLYKRREVKRGSPVPSDFESCTEDAITSKTIGWVPVTDNSEDQWHREAFKNQIDLENGTYELLGPKIQGNIEKYPKHVLISHKNTDTYPDIPRTFDALREWLKDKDIEGIVFHHPDGRMAKIKKRDFGLKRQRE